MSWQAYVDDHLMCEIDGQHLTSAAIFGVDGGVWAQSENFPQLSTAVSTAVSSTAAFNSNSQTAASAPNRPLMRCLEEFGFKVRDGMKKMM